MDNKLPVLLYDDQTKPILVVAGLNVPLLYLTEPVMLLLKDHSHFILSYCVNVNNEAARFSVWQRGFLMRLNSKILPVDSGGSLNISVYSGNTMNVLAEAISEVTISHFDVKTFLAEYTNDRPLDASVRSQGLRDSLTTKLSNILQYINRPLFNSADLYSIDSLETLLNFSMLLIILIKRRSSIDVTSLYKSYVENYYLEYRFDLIMQALDELLSDKAFTSSKTTITTQLPKVDKDLITKTSVDALIQTPQDKPNNRQFIENIKNIDERSRQELLRKLDSLAKPDSYGSKHADLETYIETVLRVPFDTVAPININIAEIRASLDAQLFGLADAKSRILEYVAYNANRKGSELGSILCLVGPPGVGKTYFAKSVAKALGKKSHTIGLGALNDVTALIGQRTGWVGAQPGQIVKGLIRTGEMNPVIVLDEIDKTHSHDERGAMDNVLIELLDPNMNNEFLDAYLDIPIDLRQIMFITTANNIQSMNSVLRNRLELIYFSPYSQVEKMEILNKYTIPKKLADANLTLNDIVFDETAVKSLVDNFKYDSGMRRLEEAVNRIIRKFVLSKLENKIGSILPFVVNSANIGDFVRIDTAHDTFFDPENSVIGEINMLSVTVDGDGNTLAGGRLPLQAHFVPAVEGKVVETGSIKEEFSESIKVAIGYFRSNASKYNIPEDFFEKNYLNIHAPSIGLHKDGPSAGIAIGLVLLSAIKKLPIPQHIAATGELDLNGNILAIGGIKEKVTGAFHIGITTFIIAQGNKYDFENDVEDKVKKYATVHFVSTLDEAIAIVFPDLDK